MCKYIKTGDIIPFDDNYIPQERSMIPIYVKTYPVKTEEEKNFYIKNKQWYEQEKENCSIYQRIYPRQDEDFNYNGYISKLRDIQTGKIIYDVPRDIFRCRKKVYSTALKRYIINSYKYDIEDTQYLIQNINGILVWRYFKYTPSYFKLNVQHGYYEVFRVCFKDDKSWIEDRNTISNYNVPYILAKRINNKIMYQNIFNKYAVKDIIQQVYPIITGSNSSTYTLYKFCMKWNKIYKNGHLFINIPDVIKKDLTFSHKIEQNKIKAKMQGHDNYYLNATDLKFTYIKTLSKDNIIIFSTYTKNLTNIERIYIKDKNIYKFGWDSIHNQWVSTLRTTNLYTMEFNEIVSSKDINKKIKNNIYFQYCNSFQDVIYSKKYLWYEQWIKQGFYNEDSIYNFYKLMNLAKTIQSVDIKDNKSFTNNFKKIQIHELLGVSSSMLKYIKEIYHNDLKCNFNNFVNLIKTYNTITKQNDKILTDNLLRLRLSKCFDAIKINSVINKLKKTDIDIQQYFRNLIKHDNWMTLIQTLLDYYKFKNNANKYNETNNTGFYYPEYIKPSEIIFMHDKAYRDYMRVKPKANRKSFEEKFNTVITSEVYLQKLYSNENYSIIPVKTPFDLDREGAELHHCVASYKNKMSINKSHIYFLRKNKDINIAYATIEIIPNDKPYLNQCYAIHDTLIPDKKAKNFVKNWCKINNIDINCEI